MLEVLWVDDLSVVIDDKMDLIALLGELDSDYSFLASILYGIIYKNLNEASKPVWISCDMDALLYLLVDRAAVFKRHSVKFQRRTLNHIGKINIYLTFSVCISCNGLIGSSELKQICNEALHLTCGFDRTVDP